jgi:predicted aspartyl protease
MLSLGGSVRRLLLLLGVFLVAVRALAAPAPIADVPMTLSRGAVLVDAMVNDKGPYTFLVDSGATACALTPDMVKWLDAPEVGSGTVSAIGTVRKAPFVRIDSLSVGGATASWLRAVVWDGQSLSRIAGQRVDGIIGTPWLWRWPVQFDYPAGRFRVYPKTYDVATEPVEAPWSGTTPLRIQDRAAYVQVALNGGRPQWMMLDTGASGLVIREETAEKCKARPSPLESWSVGAFGERRSSKYWLIGSIRVAGLTVENAQAFTPEPWGNWPSEQLGNDALDQFRVTLDATRRIARLERDTVATRFDASPWGLGLSVRREDDGVVKVASVWPASDAAEKGVRAGDELLAVSERAVGACDDVTLRSQLTSPPGLSVTVSVRTADGSPRELTLVSRRYLQKRPAPGDDAIATTIAYPRAND